MASEQAYCSQCGSFYVGDKASHSRTHLSKKERSMTLIGWKIWETVKLFTSEGQAVAGSYWFACERGLIDSQSLADKLPVFIQRQHKSERARRLRLERNPVSRFRLASKIIRLLADTGFLSIISKSKDGFVEAKPIINELLLSNQQYEIRTIDSLTGFYNLLSTMTILKLPGKPHHKSTFPARIRRRRNEDFIMKRLQELQYSPRIVFPIAHTTSTMPS